MAINPNMVLNFAQNLGQQKPLTQLGGGIAQVVEQKRAEKAREAAEEQYRNAMSAFQTERTPETYANWMNAANAVGRFEEANKMNEGMDQIHREQKVRRNSELIGPLMAGDNELFMSNLKEQATALAASDDPRDQRDAQTLQWLGHQAEQGNEQQVLDFFMASNADTPEGQAMVSNFLEQRQDRRQSMLDSSQVLKTVNDMDYLNDADRTRAIEGMSNLPGPYGVSLAEMVNVGRGYQEGEMTFEDVLDREESLRKEYDSYVEPFMTAINSATALRNLAQTSNASNFSDRAMTVLFNKVLDPDSVVRQSEAVSTEEAQAAIERVSALFTKIRGEGSYTADTRDQLLTAIDEVEKIYREAELEQRGRIDNTLQEIWGEDEEKLTRSRSRVFRDDFSPNGGLATEGEQGSTPQGTPQGLQALEQSEIWGEMTPEEKEEARGMSEEDLRVNFPDYIPTEEAAPQGPEPEPEGNTASEGEASLTPTQQQGFREFLKDRFPDADPGAIDRTSIERLIEINGGSWKIFSEREGIGQEQETDLNLDW